MRKKSRQYTTTEIREKFLKQSLATAEYWAKLDDPSKTIEDRCEGVVFSMLVMLDGGTDLPQFIVAPNPHPEDKNYCEEEGENYYPDNNFKGISGNISGGLHELLNNYKKKK